MEAYRGLAILTTNMQGALDPRLPAPAPLHRPVPVPGRRPARRDLAADLPGATRRPTDLDREKLARLNVAGGNIRNIALSAAFLAAEAGEPVTPDHVLRAARTRIRQAGADAERGRVAGAVMRRRKIVLEIERLVLHGVPAAQTRALVAG